MANSTDGNEEREQQLDAIAAEYYRFLEAGTPPAEAEFIARYPDHSTEVREFFADLRMFPASELGDGSDPALEPTLTPNMSRQKNSPAASVVRYFGAYEILEDLGSGGMGVVYKARHLRLKKFVALKMIRAGAFASEFDVKMFEAEARAVGRLDHPGIVAVYEVGMHAGQHFYSMDYVAGGNLSKLHRDEPVSVRRAADLVQQLAEAMYHAHEQGIVHRDLKPANILLTTTGAPRITDFGLAKRMWIGEDSVVANRTETGQILGTPGYMSPEQAEGKTNLVGTPADIYALGAVLYALLTSRAPFVGESQAHIIKQVIHNEPVSPRMLNPNVPRDIETICLKCLNKEPHQRYGTAQLLADDLQRFLEGRPVLARSISRPARVWRWCRRNPWVAGLSTGVAASLVIGSIVSTSLGVVAYKNSVESDRRGEALAVSLEDSQKKLAEIVELTEERTVALEESRWQVYHSRLMRMEQLWQEKDWGHLARLLDESVPSPGEKDVRGWEWHYLKAQLDRRVWRIHETPEAFATFDWDQDTDKLAVCRSGAVEIWLPGNRQLLKSIPVPVFPNGCSVLRWSPDHRYLAVGSHDLKVYVVDTETEEIVCSIPGPAASMDDAYLINIEWNPHGDGLAVTIRDQNIRLWTVAAAPVLLKEIDTCDGIVSQRIHWNPDHATCVTTSYDGWAMYWNLADWTLIEKKRIVHNSWCHDVAWSPDGTRVAFGSNIVVLSDADGMETKQLADQGATVTNLRWLDNERLITGNEANELRIVHVDQHTPDKVFRLHSQGNCTLSVGPGQQIASVCPGESVKVWSTTESYGEHVTLPGASLPLQPATLQWNSRSNELALVTMQQGGNVAATWSPGSILLDQVPGTAGTLGVYWNQSGDALAIRMTDERWNSIPWPIPEKGSPTAMTQHIGPEYSRDGRFRAEIQVNSSQVAIFETHAGAAIPQFKIDGYAYAWHPLRPCLAVARDHFIELCHLLRDRSAWITMPFSPLTQRPRSLAWSYDAKYLAGGTNSGAIHVLDGATLEIRHTLRGHTGEITAIAWLIDGSRIVSAGMDGYLRWWDVAKGVELFKVSIAEPGNICELSFSADGRWLAGRAEAGKVYVWTIEPQVTTDRRHLARLDLSNATLDTGTIQSLVNMPALKILDVSGTSLGDEVIPQFAKMDRLKSLAVEDTFISAGGVQRLRAALPDTDIQWNARGPDRSIAQRLLAKNAKVSVMMGQQRTYVVSPSDLPEIPFRVVSIKAFGKRQLSVKDFEGLEELDALESIDLLHTGVNDAVLAKVQGLTNLQNIDFGGTIVTGKPLAGFSIMPRVHTVGFGGDLMNVDVAHLNRFPNLKHAWIGWNPYGDTGLANLPLLPELELLVCEHTQIQGSGFPSLNRFQKLRVLNFSDTLVDDEGLQKLPVLPGLTELRLANTSLTDASVLHLSQFTMLKLLDLNGTSLTPSGLAELRKAIPGCTIEWSAAAVKVPVEPVKTPTLAELRAAIEAQPESVEARLRRGKWYRQRHLWGEALADLESALDGVAGTHYWDRSALAALHLHRGNIDAYRKICSELAAELLVTPDDVRLADMVRLVCLSPVGVDDFAPIMEISNTLMAKRDNELFQRNQISVLCRLKLWKEAVEAARAFRTKYQGGLGVAQPMLFQAIAFQNLGETDAARKALIEAKEYAEAQTPNPKDPVDWFSFDALYTEIAFAEASELILGERQELSLKYPAPDLEPPK